MMDDGPSIDFYWGFAVWTHLAANSTRSKLTLVKHAKSRLLASAYSQVISASLDSTFNELLKRKLIRKRGKRNIPDARDAEDVFVDFLTPAFRHAKQYLIDHHRYSDEDPIRVMMTVPVPTLWSPQSSRVLQSAIETSIRAAELAGPQNQNMERFYIISEPEAAAIYLVAATNCALVVRSPRIEYIIFELIAEGWRDLSHLGLRWRYGRCYHLHGQTRRTHSTGKRGRTAWW